MNGFYSPTIWDQRQPLSLVADCGRCGLYRKCQSPRMEPTGKGRKRVLILAEAPGENEDKRGIQLVGNAGEELIGLLSRIKVNMRKDCWLDNTLRCRPTDEHGKNRKPTKQEIDCCRPNLRKLLLELKPNVVIPLGEAAVRDIVALAWKDGEVDDISTWAGRQIPSIALNTWICPTYHPSFLVRAKGERRAEASLIEMFMVEHLHRAFQHKDKPWQKIPDYASKVFVYQKETDAVMALAVMVGLAEKENRPLAFDYETTCLKPHAKTSEILCCGVSDGQTAVVYPWHGKMIHATKSMLRSPVPKIGANIKFEQGWTRSKLGITVKNWTWDTMLGAHWLDCRRGTKSLKFQAFVRLGMGDYNSHIEDYLQSKDRTGYGLNRAKEIEPKQLMLYCGLDAFLEWHVAHYQMKEGGIK